MLVDPKSRNLYSSIQFWRLHLPCQYWSEVPSRGKNHSCTPDFLCLLFLFCVSYKEPPQPRGQSPPFKYSSLGLAWVFQRPARTVFQIPPPCPVPRIVITRVTFTEMIHCSFLVSVVRLSSLLPFLVEGVCSPCSTVLTFADGSGRENTSFFKNTFLTAVY